MDEPNRGSHGLRPGESVPLAVANRMALANRAMGPQMSPTTAAAIERDAERARREMGATMAAAREEAKAIIAAARREAEAIVKGAEESARALRARANVEAEKIIESAHAVAAVAERASEPAVSGDEEPEPEPQPENENQ